MKKITLEEHFSVPEMSYRLKRQFASEYAKELDVRLLDVEQWRLPEMDQHGIDMQVLSFTCPGIQGIPDAATAALLCALLTLGADRILFSIDYPYQRIKDGEQFIETAPISDGEKAKICYKNAEQLLKL